MKQKYLVISTTVVMMAVILAAMLSREVNGAALTAVPDARALELLARARTALGGESKLQAVQGLSAQAVFRRVVDKEGPQIEGEIELDFLMPDKYKKTESATLMGGAELTRIEGYNGDHAFTDSRSSGGMIFMRRSPGATGSQAGELRALRAESARYLLALLLSPPPLLALEYTYVGEAEAEDGRAEVIDVKGADGFATRLFLDKQTHKPLMLSYRAVQPRVVMRSFNSVARKDAEKAPKEAEKMAENDMPAPEPREVETQMYFADYRSVDGVLLPHKITRSVNGEVSEEWDINRYKINPPLKAESFKK